MQKDKLTLLRRELAHVRSSGRLSFYRATARDLAGSACEVAWYHKSEDSLAYQQAGNLLHATQIASKVQKRCIRRKIFHSQCNAISQICTDPQMLDQKSNDWRSIFLWLNIVLNLKRK